MITLHVNGESRQVAATTVAELLDELQVGAGPVAVELNREIVPKGLFNNQSSLFVDIMGFETFDNGNKKRRRDCQIINGCSGIVR